MKKTILRILTSIFFAANVVLSILYIIKYNNHENAIDFSVNMIDAFSNWVSYTLCAEDVYLWNTKQKTCDQYAEQYWADTKSLIKTFDMTVDYDYIWE